MRTSARFFFTVLLLSLFLGDAAGLSVSFATGKQGLSDSLNLEDTVAKKRIFALQHLEPAIVTADRTKISIIPSRTLHGKELERLSVHSVADAIRYFSGVQIKDYGGVGGLKTVNVRSLGSQHVGVFYDGIELGNAQNGIVDLGRFSLDNMESVSLYNGQKSSVFQTAKDFASASSVYLQTKVPVFSARKSDNYNATVKGGSFGTVNPSLLWEHKFSEKLSASLSSEYLYTTGKYKFTYKKSGGYDTTQTRHNGDVNALRVEAAVFGNSNGGASSSSNFGSEWKIKTYFYGSTRGYPGASVRGEPGKFINADRQKDRNFFTQGSYRRNFSKLYSLMLSGKYAYDWLHYNSDPHKDASTMYVNSHYRQHEFYISAANDFRIFEWWNFNLSADFQWNKLNSDMSDFAYPKRYQVYAAAATSLRLDKIKIQGSILYNFVTEDVAAGHKQAPDRNKFMPSILVSCNPLDDIDLSFRAFCKKVFRMPTLNDLYYTMVGSADLKPESALQIDAGATYSKIFSGRFFKLLKAEADVYYNKVDDKIIAMPTSNQFRWTMLNLGKVEIKGLDASLYGEGIIGDVRLNARASYTFQKAQDRTDKSSDYYGGQIPYAPKHSGSAVAGAEWRGWGANCSFIYTGERYSSIANTSVNYVPAWYTTDLSLSKSFRVKEFAINITAEANNIFDQQYEVVRCYPMPGINFRLIAKISF